MPIAVNTARITDGAAPSGARDDPRRRPDQHPLRRPHRPEQADRGSHPAGRALQALRRQLLPLHLRRPLRRRAALLRADPGARSPSSRCCPIASGSPGRCPTRISAAFYRWADVYVSLSEHEGFCVPLVEAMAADVPVLAYAAGAVPETLGGAGVLFAPKDLEFAAEMLGTARVRSAGARARARRTAPAAAGLLAAPRSTRRLGDVAREDHQVEDRVHRPALRHRDPGRIGVSLPADRRAARAAPLRSRS